MVFIGLIAMGMLGNAGAFKGLVFVMGLGTGLAGAGMLMGVWGVANMVGHAFANLPGGTIVDVMRIATGSPLVACSTLFGMEAGMLFVALYLSIKLDMNSSQASMEEREYVSSAASAD